MKWGWCQFPAGPQKHLMNPQPQICTSYDCVIARYGFSESTSGMMLEQSIQVVKKLVFSVGNMQPGPPL